MKNYIYFHRFGDDGMERDFVAMKTIDLGTSFGISVQSWSSEQLLYAICYCSS